VISIDENRTVKFDLSENLAADILILCLEKSEILQFNPEKNDYRAMVIF